MSNTKQVSEAAQRAIFLAKQNRLPRVIPADGAGAIQVLNARGEVVAATRQLVGKAPMASFQAGGKSLIAVRDVCPPAGLQGCMTVVSIRFLKPEGMWVAYAAKPVSAVYENAALLLSLAGASVLLTAIATAGTYQSVNRVLAPIRAIQSELTATVSDLDRRITVPATPEEVRTLAETVNSMLNQLEAALKRIQRYNFDVSHDLRTPITAIRVQIEEALMYSNDIQWPRTAAKVMEETMRLQAVVEDLLADLSGAQRGHPPKPRPTRPR
ncbi:histidine kinase dimerization/phospho-acceptor domain-containing protein [Actinomadura sp. HBU206391]|uniref:histidine kinase dimerization/phospho-acceptor domain-containing protein n=1 Tax=Actinomadura sp. HBU206391 TaxID=2731692 RepID=UPI00164FEB6B|nr:histidine kinase dimerization/phospho-acceptor domain-containing protein [Actinomadura sp. HBU206391]MBC6463703.1 HAMP domain-containing protein [Actinomadura sp. HBU206391]